MNFPLMMFMGGGGFNPLGVDFTRATPDFFSKTADLNDNVDSALASGCFWARMDANDSVSMAIFDPADSGGENFNLARTSGNKLGIRGVNTGGSATLILLGSTNMSNANFGSAWFHVMWSVNWASLPDTTKTLIYFNGVADTVTDSSNAASGTLDLTHTDWRVGNTSGSVPGGAFDGCLAEFMFWPGVFIDWSVAATRAKVYSNGKAVNPGSDGSLVTGTPPLVYLSVRSGGVVSDFGTNRGTGGSFIKNGAPVLSSTNPNG